MTSHTDYGWADGYGDRYNYNEWAEKPMNSARRPARLRSIRLALRHRCLCRGGRPRHTVPSCGARRFSLGGYHFEAEQGGHSWHHEEGTMGQHFPHAGLDELWRWTLHDGQATFGLRRRVLCLPPGLRSRVSSRTTPRTASAMTSGRDRRPNEGLRPQACALHLSSRTMDGCARHRLPHS